MTSQAIAMEVLDRNSAAGLGDELCQGDRLIRQQRDDARLLEAVRAVFAATLEQTATGAVLELVGRLARRLVPTDATAVAVQEGTGAPLCIAARDGAHGAGHQALAIGFRHPLMKGVIAAGETIVLPGGSSRESWRAFLEPRRTGPTAFVPLPLAGRTLGAIGLARSPGDASFTADEMRLAKMFAQHAAIAICHHEVQRNVARSNVIEDRERIARELHDGVIQSLFAVKMGLSGISNGAGAGGATTEVDRAVDELKHIIRDVRNYIFSLRPSILRGRHVSEALRLLAQDLEGHSGVVTVVDIDEAVAMELAPQAAALVQFTREALSNVGRHAAADNCRLMLRRAGDDVMLEVEDDGRGFEPASAPLEGQGLTNLEARAATLGGTLCIRSRRGEGSSVRLLFPAR